MAARGEAGEITTGKEQKQKKGKTTDEYKEVIANMETLEGTLRATKGAVESLNSKFQCESWQDIGVTCSAKELITKALNKIENDASSYKVFYTMLKDLIGLDVTLPSLTAAQEFNPAEPKQDLVVSSNKRLPHMSEQDLGYVSSQVLPENESDVLVDHASQRSSDKAIFIETKSHLQSSETSSSTPIFQLGGPEILEDKENADKIEPVDGTEHTHMQESCDGDSPVAKYTFDLQHAERYLNKDVIAMVSDLKEQIRVLTEEKQALIHEVEELKTRLQKAEEDADEKEEEANQKYKEKVNELEECKKKFSDLEREQREMEHNQQEKIKELERDAEKLERKREKEKSEDIVLICRLRQQIAEANQKLTEKQNEILEQKLKIQDFEHQKEKEECKKSLDEKTEEYQKSLDEKTEEYKKSLEKKDAMIESLSKLQLSEEVSHL